MLAVAARVCLGVQQRGPGASLHRGSARGARGGRLGAPVVPQKHFPGKLLHSKRKLLDGFACGDSGRPE